MSSNAHPHNSSGQSSHQDYPSASQPFPSSDRRSSFLSSLLSLTSPSSPSVSRQTPLSSSTGSSATTNSTTSSLATDRDSSILSGSPASSLASPMDSKFSPTEWSSCGPPSTNSRSRQASISDSLTSLTSSFRWPGSSYSSNVQPISIPNSTSSPAVEGHITPTAMPGGASAPTRRTSMGGPAFRRAFELPIYTNTYGANYQESPDSGDPSRRGRSGSLFSSFGVGDASKRTSGPPRRKLSPMGERMIRDHPF